MGKSLHVPVLCPYRVPGLEMCILGPCWLLAWGRTKQDGQLQGCHLASCWGSVCCGKVASLWGQLGGAGGTWDGPHGRRRYPSGERLQEPRSCSPHACSLLPGVSHKGQFCLLKWVAFCFDEWAHS